MKAVIMAGGKGTRLKPLTCNKPKPMVPIVNRPMMEHILELLKKHHFTEIMATLFYLPEAIQNYFGDGRRFGLKMQYFIEDSPLGTAGSVRNGADFLDETFLVISGDALTDINLEDAVRFHHQKQATATLILTKVNNPLEYGVVITDQEGKIRRFLEKPGWGEVFSDTVNTGIYILDPKIFNYFQSGQVFDFSKDLFPFLLASGERLYGYIAEGYWSDIGNLEQYRQAHYDALNGKIKLNIPGTELQPGVWVGEGAKISPDVEMVSPALIGSYTKIMPKVRIEKYSVIGDECIIQEGTSIKRGILWNQGYIGAYSEVSGAILCDHFHLQGKNTIYEGGVLGANVTIGARSIIRPQVKIWPSKTVDSGSILNESLIWAQKSSKNLFGNVGVSGIVNQEITPELVVKLGAVFGAHVKPGAKIVVSSDSFRAARVLKRALISGVLAAGVNVFDLGTLTTPVMRYIISRLGVQGGIHLRIHSQDSEAVLIQFFDETGLNITKNTERTLENAFFTEDFARAEANGMGELAFVPQLMEPYLHGMLDSEVKELIQKKHFKITADYDSGALSFILPNLLEQLGCEVIQVEQQSEMASHRPRTLKELAGALSFISEKTKASGANLGLVVDNNAEKLILLDDEGEIIKEEQITALISFLILKHKSQTTIPVQVTAPYYLEDLAREFRGQVIRTKTNPRSSMEKIAQERLFPSVDGISSFQPEWDALYCLVKIFELLARENITLAGAKKLIPQVERGYQEVECPWEDKGRIMRNLFEENKERQVEMTDGLKVFHGEGWALVLPDAEEPIFKLYSEATTIEEADALTQMYMNRIQELQVH